ncbi:MAG: hypothetical protein LBH76_01160 [Propionibacteriaceae bacterium]|nr:hypothetical protein [Propionibacteriaceae bacterium]
MAFATPDGKAFWTAAQYNDYIKKVTGFWEAESGGLVTFAVPAFGQIPVVNTAHLCDDSRSGLVSDVVRGFGYESETAFWAAQPDRTHLIMIRPREDATVDCSIRSSANGREINLVVDKNNVLLYDWQTLAHEIGHNFGLLHSGGARCPEGVQDGRMTRQGADGECKVQAWTSDNYNDYLSIMGNTNYAVSSYGLNGHQKQLLGLIGEGKGVKTVSGGKASYQLTPVQEWLPVGQATSKVQALTVVDTVDGVQWRYSIQYDKVAGGVTIRRLMRDTPAADGQVTDDSIILNPQRTNVGNRLVFGPGETLRPASGRFLVTVESVGVAGASVRVDFGSVPAFRVSRTSWTAPASGANIQELVWTGGPAWTVSSSADWLKAHSTGTATSGVDKGRLYLTAAATTTARSATVTVKSGSSQIVIKVTQDPALDDHGSSTATATKWDVAKQATVTGRLEAPGDEDWFVFTAPSSGLASITAPAPNGALSIAVDGMPGVTTSLAFHGDLVLRFDAVKGRSYVLRVKANIDQPILGSLYTLKAQFPTSAGVTLAPESWSAPAAGGSVKVAVAGPAGAAWTAVADKPFVQVSPAAGQVGQTMTLSVGPNTTTAKRQADVVVVLSNGQAARFLVQQAVSATPTLALEGVWSLRVDGSSAILPDDYPLVTKTSWKTGKAAVELCGLNVHTNQAGWSAVSSASWLKPSATTGLPYGESFTPVCLATAANDTGKDRSATVTFAAGAARIVFTVAQTSQPAVSFNLAAVTLPARGGSAKVVVSTIGAPWRARTTDNYWLTVDSGGGVAGQTVTLSATAHQSARPRTATLVITSAGETFVCTVTQEAETLSLNPVLTTATLPAAGGVVSTTVSTNADGWSVENLPDWITANPVKGGVSGGKLTLTVKANPATSDRRASVTIRGGLTARMTVTVKQEAAPPSPSDLTLAPASGTIGQSGGRLETYITSEQPWELDSRPSWVSSSGVQGAPGTTQVVFLVKANDGAQRSGTVVFTAPGADPVEFTVVQAGTAPPVNGIAEVLAEIMQKLVEVINQVLAVLTLPSLL